MKKEIIVAADDLESRVAIIEDGELAELHVERDPRLVGSIFKAKVVSVLPGMDAAFADVGLEKNVFLCADDVGFVTETGVTSSNVPRSATISERLKSGQSVVVQIIRAPVAAKGARATTRLALPGRYLVLLMSDERQIGISRKVEDRKERDRLRKIGEKIRPPGCSMIIRTEAEGRQEAELAADLKMLVDLQQRLMTKAASAKAPSLLHQDLTLTYQVIRDAFTDEVTTLVIDAKTVYDNAVELIDDIAPHLRKRIKRYRGKLPIFYKYGVEGEIDRLLRRRVWLRSGGYISIDQAEAFTAIDINTGRFTGSTGLADTILRTNLEAAEEIGRQLRLRDLGGIIVLDFIDMDRPRHRQKVMRAFQDALKNDRQKTNIVHLSPLGLIEMTRKRRGESLMGIITETCPHCAGLGRVRTALTVALKIEREVRRIAADGRPQAITVRAVPRVVEVIVGAGGQRSAALDKATGCPIYLRADDRLNPEEYEIGPGTLANTQRGLRMPAKGDELVVDQLDPGERSADEPIAGWSQGFRVEIQGLAAPTDGDVTIVLDEVGHSYALGHVKGYELPAETDPATARRRPSRRRAAPEPEPIPVAVEEEEPEEEEEEEVQPLREDDLHAAEEEAIFVESGAATETPTEEQATPARSSRRRRPRGRRRGEKSDAPTTEAAAAPEPEAAAPVAEASTETAEQAPTGEAKRRRRRPSRSRRPRTQGEGEAAPASEAVAPAPEHDDEGPQPGNEALPEAREEAPDAERPPSSRRRRRGGRSRRGEPRPPAEGGTEEGGPPTGEQQPAPNAPRERRPPRDSRPPREQDAPREPAPPRDYEAPRESAPPRDHDTAREPAPPREEPQPPAAEEGPRRTGLLRRGARQIGHPRR